MALQPSSPVKRKKTLAAFKDCHHPWNVPKHIETMVNHHFQHWGRAIVKYGLDYNVSAEQLVEGYYKERRDVYLKYLRGLRQGRVDPVDPKARRKFRRRIRRAVDYQKYLMYLYAIREWRKEARRLVESGRGNEAERNDGPQDN